MEKSPHVLSIQSHVVHGRSGNRSAIFPIELNGIEADPLNTVHFSAHTAYPHLRGSKLTPKEFNILIEGLRLNNILSEYTHLLSGYIGDPTIISEIVKLRIELGNKVHYFCDPVLGDSGKFYVSPESLSIIRDNLVPIANTITPNSYEAEWLVDQKILDQKSLLEVISKLHNLGPENVIITSTEWNHRFTFFSWEKGKIQFCIETKTLNKKFDGPGDLFTALLLSNMINFPNDYYKISSRTVNAVYSVLKETIKLGKRELAIPQSVNNILNPTDENKIIELNEFMKFNIIPL